MWRNTPTSFGLTSRLLHWVMAALILALLILGTLLTTLRPSLATLWLYGLHKTLGISVLTLTVIRLIRHRFSPPPGPLGTNALINRIARTTHATIYLLLLAIPLSSWVARSATGLDVVIFDAVTRPPSPPLPKPGRPPVSPSTACSPRL